MIVNQELYSKITTIIPTLHGWCDVPKAIGLTNVVLANRPTRIVEIGTWGGRSAIPMALACRENRAGKVICIDPWNPVASAEGQTTEADKQWWGNDNHEIVYQHFLYKMQELSLQSFVEIHRLKSSEVDPPENIEVLHVDGNHGPEAYTDTERFAAKVVPGGFCVLDDLEWAGGHVRRAEQWLLTHGFMLLHPLGTGALYLRTQ